VAKWFLAPLLAVVAVFGGWRASFAQSGQGERPQGDATTGQRLFGQDCAICHGADGKGTFQGPDITGSGLAAVDFQLRTGRMPLSAVNTGRPAPDYDDQQIADVLAYVSGFVHGIGIPSVDITNADRANGFELYELNCAACHQSAGTGGILAHDITVPAVRGDDPVVVVEAMRTAPGQMPEFGFDAFSEDDARDIAAYAHYLGSPRDAGGLNLGHSGPVTEGLVAAFVGLAAMVAIARMLGTRLELPGESRKTKTGT
jgi:ubiquinol-cytochrome c reductase cytochrome c subunit